MYGVGDGVACGEGVDGSDEEDNDDDEPGDNSADEFWQSRSSFIRCLMLLSHSLSETLLLHEKLCKKQAKKKKMKTICFIF